MYTIFIFTSFLLSSWGGTLLPNKSMDSWILTKRNIANHVNINVKFYCGCFELYMLYVLIGVKIFSISPYQRKKKNTFSATNKMVSQGWLLKPIFLWPTLNVKNGLFHHWRTFIATTKLWSLIWNFQRLTKWSLYGFCYGLKLVDLYPIATKLSSVNRLNWNIFTIKATNNWSMKIMK